MEEKNAYYTYDGMPLDDTAVVPQESGSGRKGGKYKEKARQGFEKTKAVASVGYKKVKEGTSSGFNWLKDKYQKSRNKH